MPRERVRKKKSAAVAAVAPQPNPGQQRPFSVSPGDSSCSSDSLFSGSGLMPGGHNYGPPPPHHMQQQHQHQQHHSPYGNHHYGGPPPPMNPSHHHQHHPHPHHQQNYPSQSMMYPPSNQVYCSKCHKVILERTISMCDDRYWHSACLTCSMCGHAPSPHGESLYAYRGSLICKPDYMRVKAVCSCCKRSIGPSDLVIRAKNFGLLHDSCVYCRMCSSKLNPGDRYCWTTDNLLVCQKCVGPNGSTMMAGGGQMMAPNGPGPNGPMDGGYHIQGPPGGHHQQQQQQHQQQQRQMGPGGGGGPLNGPYMSGGGPNGGGPMIKMEHNGYGNGMNGVGHHMGQPPPQQSSQQQHMNHHMQGSGTPGATPTPPPVPTTGGRRGRKKAAPQL